MLDIKKFTGIYGITAEELSRGRSNIEVVSELLEAGVKIIQYREKNKNMKEKYQECLKLREMTKKNKAMFIVNDHVDLALAVEADGVHLGQDDLPVKVVRKIGEDRLLIGLSTHSTKQALQAVEEKVDYIGVGPIFKTSTKKDVYKTVGLEYLDFVVHNINLPAVAIGGINEDNLAVIKKRGASCFALISDIVTAEDILEKTRRIQLLIDNYC